MQHRSRTKPTKCSRYYLTLGVVHCRVKNIMCLCGLGSFMARLVTHVCKFSFVSTLTSTSYNMCGTVIVVKC